MLRLEGVAQHYAWGSVDDIPSLLGWDITGEPFAEYWLGSHNIAPAITAYGNLDQLLRDHPEMVGESNLEAYGLKLPFLLKVLSAKHALSLQVHPTRSQAIEGFLRENEAGVPIDAPHRIYSDDWPKPEMIVALGPFDALVGFREPRQTARLFAQLGVEGELISDIKLLAEEHDTGVLAEVFLGLLDLRDRADCLIDTVVSAAAKHSNDEGSFGDFSRTAVELHDLFPGDSGVLAALLMNRVALEPGEGCYIAPGQVHAYLHGTGIEVMAASDNVIRGGLTHKHIDINEIANIGDFEPSRPAVAKPVAVRVGVERYESRCEEFVVWRIDTREVAGAIVLPGEFSPRIIIVVEGVLSVVTSGQAMVLSKGESAFLSASEVVAEAAGDAVAFIATSGLR